MSNLGLQQDTRYTSEKQQEDANTEILIQTARKEMWKKGEKDNETLRNAA